MPYTRTTYVNNTNPPLSAANANKSETGIQTAQAAAEAAQATASGAQAAAAAASAQAADAQTTAAGRLTQATADGLYVNVGEAINGGTAAAAGTALQHRSATAAQWTSSNPVLRANEIGYESDTNKLKLGNGTSTWTVLPYVTGSGGSGATQVSELSDAATVVRTTGAQGIADQKTFSTTPLIGSAAPTSVDHATRKGYVDGGLATKPTLDGFGLVPVALLPVGTAADEVAAGDHGTHGIQAYNAAGAPLTLASSIQFTGDAVATHDGTRVVVNVPNQLSGTLIKAGAQVLTANSETLQNLTVVTFTLAALTNYRIHWCLKYQVPAVVGFKTAVVFPAGTTTVSVANGWMQGYDMAGAWSRVLVHATGVVGTFRGLGTPAAAVEGDLLLMVGDVGGAFTLQGAIGVAGTGTPSVFKSSFLEWQKV